MFPLDFFFLASICEGAASQLSRLLLVSLLLVSLLLVSLLLYYSTRVSARERPTNSLDHTHTSVSRQKFFSCKKFSPPFFGGAVSAKECSVSSLAHTRKRLNFFSKNKNEMRSISEGAACLLFEKKNLFSKNKMRSISEGTACLLFGTRTQKCLNKNTVTRETISSGSL